MLELSYVARGTPRNRSTARWASLRVEWIGPWSSKSSQIPPCSSRWTWRQRSSSAAHSRAEAEALPLSKDGVTLFRLTRNHRSSEVVSLLMNPQGALAHLHKRMADASCDVAPEWAGGAKLCVPFTPEQLDELESMGLELENHHRCLT